MDLAGYRQFMSDSLNASPELRHEIHYVVAENDIVAVGITLHMVHTGKYLGIAPTGQSMAIEEIVVLKMTNGKIVEEWVDFDFAEFVFLQGEQSQDILLRAQIERLRRS